MYCMMISYCFSQRVFTIHNVHSVLTAPFPSAAEANIAFNSLRVDPEPRKSLVTKQLSVDQNQLIA